MNLLALLTALRHMRGLVSRAFEVLVPPTTTPATGHQDLLSFLHQVGDYSWFLLPIKPGHGGAQGHGQVKIFALAAMLVLAGAIAAPLSSEVMFVPVGRKGAVVCIRDEIDVASPSSIATIRSTPRHELLSSEAHNPGPSITGFQEELDAVDHLTII
jgi:hypothetical protein